MAVLIAAEPAQPIGPSRRCRICGRRRSKNGDRPIFRSWLPLDEDVATRSAGLGRVHTELGFGRLALLDAWQAIGDDPTNFAAHRLLADGYSTEPRHEIARVSELLVSQLLQPANVTPIKPQLAQQNLFIAQRAGPSHASFDELASPVVTNGLKLRASAVGGSNGIEGDDVSLGGAARSRVVQRRPLSLRDRRLPRQQRSRARGRERVPSVSTESRHEPASRAALGAHGARRPHDVLRSRLLLAVASARRGRRLAAARRQAPAYAESHAARFVDLPGRRWRASRRGDCFSLADGRASATTSTSRTSFASATRSCRAASCRRSRTKPREHAVRTRHRIRSSTRPTHSNRQLGLYSYVTFNPLPTLTVTAGASFDAFEIGCGRRGRGQSQARPRLAPDGAHDGPRGRVRDVVQRPDDSSQNAQPRLEPVQVAGFTQFLFGGRGDRATCAASPSSTSCRRICSSAGRRDSRDTERSGLVPFAERSTASCTHAERARAAGLSLLDAARRSSASARATSTAATAASRSSCSATRT